MKGLPLLLIASLLFMTSSCNQLETKGDLLFEKNIKQIIFFSDDKEYEREASYYDAIIELKKEFPNEIKSMKTINAVNAKKYYDTFDIQSCPAIILIYNEKVLVKVKGEATKEQIIQPITNALKEEL